MAFESFNDSTYPKMTHSDWMLQITLLYSTNQISSLKSRIGIQWCPGKVQILLVINNPKANYPFDNCQSSNLRPCDKPMEDVLCLGLILSEPWLNGYGHEFESLHQTLDGSFFKFICHQILLTSQKTENKWKRGGRLRVQGLRRCLKIFWFSNYWRNFSSLLWPKPMINFIWWMISRRERHGGVREMPPTACQLSTSSSRTSSHVFLSVIAKFVLRLLKGNCHRRHRQSIDARYLQDVWRVPSMTL